jgi:hypothetical protein
MSEIAFVTHIYENKLAKHQLHIPPAASFNAPFTVQQSV